MSRTRKTNEEVQVEEVQVEEVQVEEVQVEEAQKPKRLIDGLVYSSDDPNYVEPEKRNAK